MGDHGGDHKAPNYMLIWLYLFLLTIAEVGVAMLPISKTLIVISLLIMAFWKAWLVLLYYMHMKWEPKRLKWLAASPIGPVIIMIVVIMMEYV